MHWLTNLKTVNSKLYLTSQWHSICDQFSQPGFLPESFRIFLAEILTDIQTLLPRISEERF